MMRPESVSIVGAGPTGALLAILLRRRGVEVTLYESRSDPRGRPGERGRSINLALAGRGIHALKVAGLLERVEPLLLPMRARFIHGADGSHARQPYGQRPEEINHSISRHTLNQVLLDAAIRDHGARACFDMRLEGVDFATRQALFRTTRDTERSEPPLRVAMRPMIACDGAGSVMRHAMAASGAILAEEHALDHRYKELSIPPTASGDFALAPDVLHIWPRGAHMMIALPNLDHSFTATVFLPATGPVSFAALNSSSAIESFLRTQFADALPHMPDAVQEFEQHPTGFLGTVYASPWNFEGTSLLLGDAAHAIVPFHGQGMNCCLEDCIEFDAALDRHASWSEAFTAFGAARKPDTDAIAAMALENYAEMRERVLEPRFKLQQALARELERRFPDRFIPRYAMVQFYAAIPYREALRRGRLQQQVLDDLTGEANSLEDIDFERARDDIERTLEPVAQIRSSV